MKTLPIVAASIGDPAGIGPEVCVKAIASGELAALCHPLLIGDVNAVKQAMAISKLSVPVTRVDTAEGAASVTSGIAVLDPGGLAPGSYSFGKSSVDSGNAVLEWISIGKDLGEKGRIQGMIMGPVDSDSIKMTGKVKDIDDLQPPDTWMLRISGALRAVPLTEHIRFRDILSTVTPENILRVVQLLDRNLRSWGLAKPRIAVAALNCHAMFEEDREIVKPAVDKAIALGIDARGPISPDSIFRMCIEGKHDAVVTMYHDQGQIAVKTAAFEGACTVYMGLSYVLLNVPHGSAFDIAGKGVAQHLSMLAAMKTAATLAGGRGLPN